MAPAGRFPVGICDLPRLGRGATLKGFRPILDPMAFHGFPGEDFSGGTKPLKDWHRAWWTHCFIFLEFTWTHEYSCSILRRCQISAEYAPKKWWASGRNFPRVPQWRPNAFCQAKRSTFRGSRPTFTFCEKAQALHPYGSSHWGIDGSTVYTTIALLVAKYDFLLGPLLLGPFRPPSWDFWSFWGWLPSR